MTRKKSIYIAGPLFSSHERTFLEQLVDTIAEKLDIHPVEDIFLPHRDAGDLGLKGKGRDYIFDEDLNHLDEADVVIALLDGPDVDSGTSVELGYAYAKNKQIFGILTDFRNWRTGEVEHINNMVWGVCGRGKRIYREINDETIKELKKYLTN